MSVRTVKLTEHFDSFVQAGIESGRYADVNDVIREGLRLLEQREAEDKAKLEWLRGAVQEGMDDINRGQYTSLDSSAAIENLTRSLRSQQ